MHVCAIPCVPPHRRFHGKIETYGVLRGYNTKKTHRTELYYILSFKHLDRISYVEMFDLNIKTFSSSK